MYAAWDSLEPRLVFADWLEDHGDPRGEFIQLECFSPQGEEEGHRRLQALRQRERELRDEAERAWLGEFHEARITLEFDRGIPVGLKHADMFVEIVSHERMYALRFLEGGQVKGGPACPDWVFDSKWQKESAGGVYRVDAREGALRIDLQIDEANEDEYYWRGEVVSMTGMLTGPGPQLTLHWRGLVTGNTGLRTLELMSAAEFKEALAGTGALG